MSTPSFAYVPARPSAAAREVLANFTVPSTSNVTPNTERVLGIMPKGVAADIRRALRHDWRGEGFAMPTKWRPTTQKFNVEAIHDGCCACAEYGVMLTGLQNMGEVSSVDAIMRRYDEGRWSAQNVVRVLNVVRRFHRILFGEAPEFLKVRLNYWTRLPRRRQRGRSTIEEYLRGAEAIGSIADLFEAAGETNMSARMRCDAALLAGAADLNARRNEYASSDLDLAKERIENDEEIVDIYMRAEARKNNKVRIGVIRDHRALNLLRVTIGDRKEGPLFSRPTGEQMTNYDIAASLRRSSLLALGVHSCANDLRDAGASLSTLPLLMATRIGSSGRVAVKHYRRPMAEKGLALARAAMAPRNLESNCQSVRNKRTIVPSS